MHITCGLRLAQEKILEGQMYPWRRSFRQSWRPPVHDHPEEYSNRPFKPAIKMGFPAELKTAPYTIMPMGGQEYKLKPIEEQQVWRLQMPAGQFILVRYFNHYSFYYFISIKLVLLFY